MTGGMDPASMMMAMQFHNANAANMAQPAERPALPPVGKPADPEPVEGDLLEIDRGEGKLGIDVDWANGKSLCVAKVSDGGAVDTYNRAHLDDRLLIGDYILEVNGVSGSVNPMMMRLQKDTVLKMIIKRRPRMASV
mmetsp:Transcript_83819/g.157812  ORF Transcript_83819/g.157812 Transcript_83819/m.157812 type:complete len:137 (-) Transcript_83819:81-491(-)